LLTGKSNSDDRDPPWGSVYPIDTMIYPELIFERIEFHLSGKRDPMASAIVAFYRVCHGFRLMKEVDYFPVNFDHFYIEHH